MSERQQPLSPDLPILFNQISNQAIPSALQQRLSYLWKAAHSSLEQSLPLSHNLSRNFINLVNTHSVALPQIISSHICSHCSVLLYPSQTSTVRLKKKHRHSRFNRKFRDGMDKTIDPSTGNQKSSKKSVKNILQVTCKLCEHTNSVPAFYRTPTTKAVVDSLNLSHASSSTKSTTSSKNKTTKSFNFLDSINRRHSAPSRLMSMDCIPLSSQTESSSKRTVNLLELERLNKKNKRRKTLAGMGAEDDVDNAKDNSGGDVHKAKKSDALPKPNMNVIASKNNNLLSLSSLQKTFMIQK